MSENSEVSLPPIIKTSNNPQIQERVDEQLTQMEEQDPSADFSRTKLDLVKANSQARNLVARDLVMERRKERLGRIENEASHDNLTGLLNRKGFEELFVRDVKRARRNGGKMVFINMDLNGLRDINNTLGHEEGDNFIKEAADTLRQTLRETDVVAHPSGDEFWAYLDNPNEEGVEAWFDRVGKYTESQKTRVRFSAGASEIDLSNTDESRKKADEAMYAAKLNKGDKKNHLMIVQSDGNFVEYIPNQNSEAA